MSSERSEQDKRSEHSEHSGHGARRERERGQIQDAEAKLMRGEYGSW